MKWRDWTVEEIAEMICIPQGTEGTSFFKYRSSYYITRFFRDADTDFAHHSSHSRAIWTADTLRTILEAPHADEHTPPDAFCRVIRVLMDPGDAANEGPERLGALTKLNTALAREGFEAFYAEDNQCYVRHIGTRKVAGISTSPHRPFSAVEVARRAQLSAYLDTCSEDDLIGEILLPMLRHLSFERITAAGHKDKSNEFGKDVWMRFRLPTQHYLYFGIQAKKGKIDAAGMTRGSNVNVAEIHRQALMMLGHEIFDPETNKKVLVDHAFIVAGGEITKAAQQWIAGQLDASKRSQIIFMHRDDILNLYVVNSVPLPAGALPKPPDDDDKIPF
jgi:hypothetical protein